MSTVKWKSIIGILLLFLFIFLNGCATKSFKSSPLTPDELPQKVLLMPIDIQLCTLTAGGVLKPEAKWTANAKKNVRYCIKEKMKRMNNQLLCQKDFEKKVLNEQEKKKRLQLIKLHETVGHSILLHQYNPQLKLPGKKKFDWSLGSKARFLKEKYGADHALFVYLRDSYASEGRVALFVVAAVFGVGIQMGQQVGFASLVNLETGDIIWFNRLIRSVGDLRTKEASAKSIELLLKGFPK